MFLICRAPSGVSVNRSPVVIKTLEPCFLQAIIALGDECFILQKNLDVSPKVAFNDEGVTATLDEMPVNEKRNLKSNALTTTPLCPHSQA